MASKLPSLSTSSRSNPTHQQAGSPDLLDDLDYFPMVLASAEASALTFVGHSVFSAYLALQLGAEIQTRLWRGVIPIFSIEADLATFSRIVTWSGVLTAGLLAVFSLLSFFGRTSLRVQAGRLFAWIDIALLGAMQLFRHYFLGSYIEQPIWMWAMVVVGIVAFIVGGYVVSLDAHDREAELTDQSRAKSGDRQLLPPLDSGVDGA